MRASSTILASVAFLFVLPGASSVVGSQPDVVIEEILVLSGVKHSLEQLTTEAYTQALSYSSARSAELSPENEAVIADSLKSAYAMEIFYNPVKRRFKKVMDETRAGQLLGHFRSPLMQKMIKLEQDASSPQSMSQMEKYVADLERRPAPSGRMKLVRQITDALGGTRMIESMMAGMLRGMAKALNPVLPPEKRATPGDIEKIIGGLVDPENPRMKQINASILNYALFMYRTASERELKEYNAILSTEAVQWFYDVFQKGFTEGMEAAGEKMAGQIKERPIPVSARRAVANPKVAERIHHYNIRGRTAENLRREMDRRGPKDADRRFDSYTRWFARWDYRYKQAAGDCQIASVNISVEIDVTLPQWTDASGASSGLASKWESYLNALKRHEDGHRDIGVRAAEEINLAIVEMGARSNCDDLGRAANALAESILEKYRQEERAYDAETDHGATQGARFP